MTDQPIHAAVARLTTPEDCEEFAQWAQTRTPDLAAQARRRAVELRAAAHGASNTVEQELYAAVYAYEAVLANKRDRRVTASRTWQMIRRHGIVQAAERAVNRPQPTAGYNALVELGLANHAFEAVILRHPESFSPEAVARAAARMNQLRAAEEQ
jgi:hypothetical protein